MTSGGWQLLDSSVDAAAVDSSHTVKARVITCFASAGLIGAVLGPRTAALWLSAIAFGELWTWISLRPLRVRPVLSRLERLNCLAAMAALTLAWSFIGILYWRAGDVSLRIVAFCSVAGQLIHAQCFSCRSKAALIVTAMIPAAVLLCLVTLASDYHGATLFVLTASLLIMIGYVCSSALLNRRQSQALESARAEALAASTSKSAFLAMIGHELRTPMNGVLGLAQALASSGLADRQAEQVSMLIQSGNGLMTILNDLLDISKIEAGKLDIEETAFDLHDLAHQVHSLWRHAANKSGVRFRLDIAAETPQWLVGDPVRIRQIMQNLASNALKFTTEGEVCLALLARDDGVDGRRGFEISVSDTGVGLSEEQQSRLFQPYSQASVSTARQYGGTGLGLSICRQLTGLMGGEISVQSAPGEGATFRVVLHLPPAEPVVAAAPAGQQDSLEAVRVLVADDHPTNLAVARAILESLGCLVETVEDGAQALERLLQSDFDVVLMDVHMPRMGGVEAVRRIRDGQAGRANMPVIALSADVVTGDQVPLEACGFDAVQPKPIQMTALANAIIHVLRSAHTDMASPTGEPVDRERNPVDGRSATLSHIG